MIPMMTFMHPGRLWLIAVPVVLLIVYIILSFARRSGSSKNQPIQKVIPKGSAIARHVAVLAALMSLVSLAVAYAKPAELVNKPRDRATVVITMDISRSMKAQDITPTRIEAAKTAAKDFVDAIPETYNVAVVSFAGTATMVSPPTLDKEAAKRAIDSLNLAPATAVGEGIYTSLDALALAPPDPDNPDEFPPGAIVLLSDGSTNMGRSPETAATESGEMGIPVYTIAYGTPGGYIVDEGGSHQPVPVDHHELSVVANLSGGKKYSAESMGDLRAIYEELASSIGYEQVESGVTEKFAGYALILAVLAAAGVISLAARWPS